MQSLTYAQLPPQQCFSSNKIILTLTHRKIQFQISCVLDAFQSPRLKGWVVPHFRRLTLSDGQECDDTLSEPFKNYDFQIDDTCSSIPTRCSPQVRGKPDTASFTWKNAKNWLTANSRNTFNSKLEHCPSSYFSFFATLDRYFSGIPVLNGHESHVQLFLISVAL